MRIAHGGDSRNTSRANLPVQRGRWVYPRNNYAGDQRLHLAKSASSWLGYQRDKLWLPRVPRNCSDFSQPRLERSSESRNRIAGASSAESWTYGSINDGKAQRGLGSFTETIRPDGRRSKKREEKIILGPSWKCCCKHFLRRNKRTWCWRAISRYEKLLTMKIKFEYAPEERVQ